MCSAWLGKDCCWRSLLCCLVGRFAGWFRRNSLQNRCNACTAFWHFNTSAEPDLGRSCIVNEGSHKLRLQLQASKRLWFYRTFYSGTSKLWSIVCVERAKTSHIQKIRCPDLPRQYLHHLQNDFDQIQGLNLDAYAKQFSPIVDIGARTSIRAWTDVPTQVLKHWLLNLELGVSLPVFRRWLVTLLPGLRAKRLDQVTKIHQGLSRFQTLTFYVFLF